MCPRLLAQDLHQLQLHFLQQGQQLPAHHCAPPCPGHRGRRAGPAAVPGPAGPPLAPLPNRTPQGSPAQGRAGRPPSASQGPSLWEKGHQGYWGGTHFPGTLVVPDLKHGYCRGGGDLWRASCFCTHQEVAPTFQQQGRPMVASLTEAKPLGTWYWPKGRPSVGRGQVIGILSKGAARGGDSPTSSRVPSVDTWVNGGGLLL